MSFLFLFCVKLLIPKKNKEASTARMEGSNQDIVKTVLSHLGDPVVRFEHVYEFDQIKDAFGHFDMEVIPTGDIYEFICTPKGHVCTCCISVSMTRSSKGVADSH